MLATPTVLLLAVVTIAMPSPIGQQAVVEVFVVGLPMLFVLLVIAVRQHDRSSAVLAALDIDEASWEWIDARLHYGPEADAD